MLRVALILALVLAVAGCVGDDDRAQPTGSPSSPSAPKYQHYVAIGDSFTAGPGIPDLVPQSGACWRSTNNYPSLLARALAVPDVRDESCSGATTASAMTGSNGGIAGSAIPPQLDALTAQTDLVTIGLGGNDGGFFTALTAACVGTGKATTCKAFTDQQLDGILLQVRNGVTDVVNAVKRRSPDATIVLVGYLRLSPGVDTCAAAATDTSSVTRIRTAERRLERSLDDVADTTDVQFVPMGEASAGHDVCSGTPWTNGNAPAPNDGVLFHPRLAGMAAVATEIERALR